MTSASHLILRAARCTLTGVHSCHLNSIDKDRDGNYLVSLRHTCGVYYINGTTGDLIWTLGSVNSSFESLGECVPRTDLCGPWS